MTKNSPAIVLFFVLSILPGLDTVFDIAPSKLGGAESTAANVPLSFETFWTEEWQRSIDKWWSRALGFRGIFIRSDNQLCLSLFNELGSQNRQRVIVGKDDYLFEKGYITAYKNSVNDPQVGAIQSIVAGIRRSEDFLKSHGIPMIVLISPSKASVLPDKLPAGTQPEGEPLRDYRAFVEELERQGVTFFDGRKWLVENKANLLGPIFYRSGAHWSQESGCRVAAQVFSILQSKLQKPLRTIACEPVKERVQARGQDADLLRLANIWTTARFTEPYLYPAGPIDRSAGKFVPKVIFVGSSFLWDPIDMIRKARLADRKRSRLYYYFKTRAINPNNKLGPIDPASTKWREEVLGSDAVIVEINESAVLQVGFGFFEALNSAVPPGSG